jgi:hypothetical protein
VVVNDAGFAVHQGLCSDDLAAKGRADASVSQAHAQNGQLAGKVLDRCHRHTRLSG